MFYSFLMEGTKNLHISATWIKFLELETFVKQPPETFYAPYTLHAEPCPWKVSSYWRTSNSEFFPSYRNNLFLRSLSYIFLQRVLPSCWESKILGEVVGSLTGLDKLLALRWYVMHFGTWEV